MLKWLRAAAAALAISSAVGCQDRKPERAPAPASSILVDINHATLQELEALPAVGEAYGRRIMAGRPYANKTQLRSREIVPDSVYDRIHDLVIARQD